jgi:hypothetical protein
MLTLDIINFEKPIAVLKKGVADQTNQTLNNVAIFAQQSIKKNLQNALSGAKYSKGTAVNSIVVTGTGNEKRINGAAHLSFIEKGTGVYVGNKAWITSFGGKLAHPIKTKGMKPRPFWYKGIEETNNKVPDIFDKEFSNIL